MAQLQIRGKRRLSGSDYPDDLKAPNILTGLPKDVLLKLLEEKADEYDHKLGYRTDTLGRYAEGNPTHVHLCFTSFIELCDMAAKNVRLEMMEDQLEELICPADEDPDYMVGVG
jgi:hypothetical protein